MDDEGEGGAPWEEMSAARHEFDDMRHATELGVQAAMQAGRSVQTAAHEWDHSKLSTVDLKAALLQVQSFPRPSTGGKRLAKEGLSVVRVREALQLTETGPCPL